jgi:hypothetical protein
VSSCGFWPGNEAVPHAAFYSYLYPEPKNYKKAAIQSEEAVYNQQLGEHVLPYQAVQESENPSQTLLEFLRSTYSAAADLAGWDRNSLEREDSWRNSMSM